MFVVRIILLDDDERQGPRFKVFERKPDANNYFRAASVLANRDEIEEVALFEVTGLGVREAVEAVKSGDSDVVLFLQKTICYRHQIEDLASQIDLSDLLE
ncbi:MAG: hypothetical protein GY789_20660 [Hyphomicrobiales bacterium]|nr:hypothetical protein [Hyphomicrobiales bacterium]